MLASLAVSCEIENDIPYPVLDGDINAFAVQGMCDAEGNRTDKATVDKNKMSITAYVDDSVDITALLIEKFEVSNDATILPEGQGPLFPDKFPKKSFSSASSDATRTDFSNPVKFKIQTYQDYIWTINISQVIKREVEMEGQVEDAVVDPVSRNVIVYVGSNQDVKHIKVKKFSLGGSHGTVLPNPVDYEDYDFSALPTKFFVKNAWADYSYEWNVYVYRTEAKTTLTASAFARTVDATVKGTKPSDEVFKLEYKAENTSEWKTCPTSAVTTKGVNYEASLTGLKPATKYAFRTSAGSQSTPEDYFTTSAAAQLENPSFDFWHIKNGKLYNPWAEDGESYWDTGNKGATTVGASNSVPSEDSSTGSGYSACLQSKFIVIKFAAGNIFTGRYKRTDGANGVLDFGRPFASFPSKLSFDYKYQGATINRVGSSDYEHLKGQPDEAMVYIALTDWDQPLEIRTNPSNLSLFDKNDPHVIAYAEMVTSKDQPTWATETLKLQYRATDRTPKYILVVCSASRYGDFFTGGEGSTLFVDNLNLIYE